MRNQEAVPNPDIFQYVEDGYQYLNFKLPSSIHPPPLAPILITAVAKIITPYTVYPEIASVHLINITSSALTLVGIYLIGQYFLHPSIAFLLSTLVATNQIYILYSLGVTSEIIYAFFLSLSLVCYAKSKKPLSYLLLGLLFLLRYESIVVPISVFLIEFFYVKKQFKLRNLATSFLPIIIWLVVLNYHSYGSSLIDNAYLTEIWTNYKKIPNLLSFQSLVEMITFEPSFFTPLRIVFVYIILSLTVLGSSIRKDTSPLVKICYLIFGFHILFLYLFPNFNVRYYLPIIWITYLILINHQSRVISLTMLACLLFYNLGRINSPSLYSNPNEKLEYRLTANWLNDQTFPTKVKVLIYEPWILDYFVTNPQVEVVDIRDTPLTSCQGDLACISQIISSTSPHVNIRYFMRPDIKFNPQTAIYNTPVYVVTPSAANRSLSVDDDQFTPKIHFMNSFSSVAIDANKSRFKFVSTVSSGSNWANIYQYIGKK